MENVGYRKGGENMNDEQIKEITIAIINNKMVYTGSSNEETAEEIAKFINKLREKTNEIRARYWLLFHVQK